MWPRLDGVMLPWHANDAVVRPKPNAFPQNTGAANAVNGHSCTDLPLNGGMRRPAPPWAIPDWAQKKARHHAGPFLDTPLKKGVHIYLSATANRGAAGSTHRARAVFSTLTHRCRVAYRGRITPLAHRGGVAYQGRLGLWLATGPTCRARVILSVTYRGGIAYRGGI